jgi:mRNA interferase RelE/StbE
LGEIVRIRFHNRAVKFLEKLDEKDREKIRLKLKALLAAIESQGIIPFKELDIKRLEGEWKGFLRMRIARIRIIFRIDKENDVLLVYEIDHRGDVYK